MSLQKSDIENRVAEIFSTALKRKIGAAEEVSRENEPQWDSLVNLELVMGVEEAFDIRLSPEQIEGFKSKSWIIDAVLDSNGAA